jgi:hypothetical protein
VGERFLDGSEGLDVREVLLAAALILASLWASVPVASAGAEWCEDDPLVVIHTAGGKDVPLHVTNYAEGKEHLAALRTAHIDVQTEPAQRGQATRATITVQVADDGGRSPFRTRSVVSTGPNAAGTVLAQDNSRSGRAMVLRFTLDLP